MNMISNKNLILLITSVILAIPLSSILNNLTGIDSMALLPLFAVVVLFMPFLVKKLGQNVFFSFICLQFIFIPMLIYARFFLPAGINIKLHVLAFGVAIFGSVCFLIKNFRHLWQNVAIFRYLFIFFIINTVYFFFYSSDFNVTGIQAGYPVAVVANEFNNNFDASFIVFLNSLSALLGVILGSAVFFNAKTKQDTEKIINSFFSVMPVIMLFYFLVSISSGFEFNEQGYGVFIPLFFFLTLGIKIHLYLTSGEESALFYKTPMFMALINILLLLNPIVLIVILNKSGLIGFAVASIVFLIACIAAKINIFRALTFDLNFNVLKYATIPCLVIFGLILANFDVAELVQSRIDYFVHGYTKLTTFSVRLTNWYYFCLDWLSNLTVVKAFIGFGLAESREAIFYLSAMQPKYHLMQTTHNHFMEIFYDYGLLGLLYIASLFTLFASNFRCLTSKLHNNRINALCIINITLLTYYLIYHLTDGTRVLNIISFFCLIGFLDALRRKQICQKELHG